VAIKIVVRRGVFSEGERGKLAQKKFFIAEASLAGKLCTRTSCRSTTPWPTPTPAYIVMEYVRRRHAGAHTARPTGCCRSATCSK
jgi:hypothetical protein